MGAEDLPQGQHLIRILIGNTNANEKIRILVLYCFIVERFVPNFFNLMSFYF